MRVLVTGCAGFIGYHFCDRLLNEGCEVVGIDNFSTGQQRNVADLSARSGFQFFEHNIVHPIVPARAGGPRDQGEKNAICSSAPRPLGLSAPLILDGPFDWICNLACPASPADFDSKRLDILAVCSQGVWNLLEFARHCGAKRFLHSSTSEIYGDPQVHPQTESYWGNVNSIGPRSCYDEGKRFAEALLSAYRRQYGLPTRMARIFNTYGPRMRLNDGRALPNFIMQALSGQPLTVHGDGRQTRSFCYVTDLVDGLWRLARSEVTEPVNLGNPVEITIVEFAREIVRLLGSQSPILLVPRPADDPNVRQPDITRAQTLLGWNPKVDRSTGLALTIEWFKTLAAG